MQLVESGTFGPELNATGTLVVSASVKRVLLVNEFLIESVLI